MRTFVHKKQFHIGIAVVLILSMVLLLVRIFSNQEVSLVTATAETGSVRQYVSVSGVTKAKEKADLGFTSTGIVETVLVEAGDTVEAGDILAILESDSEESERVAALAGLRRAIADRGELIAGPSQTERTVTSETVQLKKEVLSTTIAVETAKVKNAKRTLLSDGLTAYTNDADEDATAPIISGTYTCENEGSYTLSVFASDSSSGYSYRLDGLETGTYTASTDQPSPLGSCGLRILFAADSRYTNSTWMIDIPNKKSSVYTLNKNAYDLAVIQAGSAIDVARQELALAEADENNANASPRSEALDRADATVAEAEANVSRLENELNERILRAPFSGTITNVSIKTGEVVSTDPVMTLLTTNAFEVTARIPEIDVAKVVTGQRVELLFDADDSQTQTGTVTFVSLEATEIDGVAYFDAYITLEQNPTWMRSGLNADINIIISETSEGVRIPKRFLIEEAGTFSVLVQQADGMLATTTVEMLLRGNDGFVAISGVSPQDTLVAP